MRKFKVHPEEYVCARIYIAVINYHDPNKLGEERVYFFLQFSGHSPSMREVWTGTQCKSLSTGIEA